MKKMLKNQIWLNKFGHFLSRLRSNDPSFTEFDLRSEFPPIGISGASALATALQHNSTLTTLHLSNNSIGASGASALAIALQHNSTLTSLLLPSNSIGDLGASALATALPLNSTLPTLDLRYNPIGDAEALVTALQRNSSLTKFDFYFPAQLRERVSDSLNRNEANAAQRSCSLFALLLPFLFVASSHSEEEQQSHEWNASSWSDVNPNGQMEEAEAWQRAKKKQRTANWGV